jgi:hypothetical protein
VQCTASISSVTLLNGVSASTSSSRPGPGQCPWCRSCACRIVYAPGRAASSAFTLAALNVLPRRSSLRSVAELSSTLLQSAPGQYTHLTAHRSTYCSS